MKEFIKNKLLIILFLFVILIINIISTCLAVDLTYNNEKVSLSDSITSYKYYCIFEFTNNSDNSKLYSVYCTNSRDFMLSGSTLSVSYNIETSYQSNGILYYCSVNNLSSLSSINSNSFSSNINGISIDMTGYTSTFVYTNSNIYGTKKNVNGFSCIDYDNVVFQGAPVTVEQVTIPAIQQVGEIPQAMKEVLKILIPVGLVIFGIGLVIFLIRYLRLRLM